MIKIQHVMQELFSPSEKWQTLETLYLSAVLVVAVLGNLLIAFTLLRRRLLRHPSNRSDPSTGARLKGRPQVWVIHSILSRHHLHVGKRRE